MSLSGPPGSDDLDVKLGWEFLGMNARDNGNFVESTVLGRGKQRDFGGQFSPRDRKLVIRMQC
jgi:hypothetical protein